jgi:sugar/nucleoside kinase (ribokinase family)
VVEDLGKRLIVTFGSRGVLLLDVPAGLDRLVPVQAVPVTGTTVGCGDAFIAYLLAEWWASGDLGRAVERGKVGGALPTAWFRPLPDAAYGQLLRADDQQGVDPPTER